MASLSHWQEAPHCAQACVHGCMDVCVCVSMCVEKESDYEALARVSREAEKSHDCLQARDPGKLRRITQKL